MIWQIKGCDSSYHNTNYTIPWGPHRRRGTSRMKTLKGGPIPTEKIFSMVPLGFQWMADRAERRLDLIYSLRIGILPCTTIRDRWVRHRRGLQWIVSTPASTARSEHLPVNEIAGHFPGRVLNFNLGPSHAPGRWQCKALKTPACAAHRTRVMTRRVRQLPQ